MNRKEHNRMMTIRTIEDTFMQLYKKKGLEKITIHELCETAGISRTNLYRYYDDKYQILQTIEDRLLENIEEINKSDYFINQLENDIEKKLPLLYKTVCYIDENRDYFATLLGRNGDPSFVFKWKSCMRKNLESKTAESKVFDYDLDVVVEIMVSSFIGIYTFWLIEKPELSCESITKICGDILYGNIYKI